MKREVPTWLAVVVVAVVIVVAVVVGYFFTQRTPQVEPAPIEQGGVATARPEMGPGGGGPGPQAPQSR
ncbi:MAG: hypothetical protein NZ959_11385 [Armatimonadetes bacterium]|nr:hypothetical protein [Armatimonadota bacterium]MDW8122936.1 hypothetical protein [Armatimonadota bacterium]